MAKYSLNLISPNKKDYEEALSVAIATMKGFQKLIREDKKEDTAINIGSCIRRVSEIAEGIKKEVGE